MFYYLFIPYLTKGKTLGGSFLNVRNSAEDALVVRAFFKSVFLYVYYFGIPLFIMFMGNNLNNLFYLLLIVIFIFYLKNVFTLVKKGKIYYDEIFEITYESTIKRR